MEKEKEKEKKQQEKANGITSFVLCPAVLMHTVRISCSYKSETCVT